MHRTSVQGFVAMIQPNSITGTRSWSSVARWTLFGTLACALASITFTRLILGEVDPETWTRVLISATALPIVIGGPLFFLFSVRLRKLKIANARLGRVARTDSLTACLNRGAFTDKVDEWLRDGGTAKAGALLMIDADNFKAINDLYGHDVGDVALTIIVRAIRSVLRNGDIVGRMGGEEFGVFLPHLDQAGAERAAERIRLAVNTATFTPDGQQRPLSVSIGGAVFAGETSFSELFRIADQRLYGAKNAGRNMSRVEQIEDNPVILLKRTA